ncbi:MAG: histidinol dehydrogenase [Planctomycetes bacterium]|nr:histidinol dehydrogenase [Planctomycetota bacterium]
MTEPLPVLPPDRVAAARTVSLDDATLDGARAIVDDVRRRGTAALRECALRYDQLAPSSRLVLDRDALLRARDELPAADLAVLERTAARIRAFALAQRQCLTALDVAVAGGRAGHEIRAVERAGCYAPGGRYPLPSSVLMTAVTARAAGVDSVWVASPRPTAVTLAAAAVAGADAVVACGGAHAIAALAYGAGAVPACDVVVGPGNRWVTAAKKLVAGDVGIDMLAGPSELVVLADATADPATIAADLLAQAEHDVDARPVLIAVAAEQLVRDVQRELTAQLTGLPTAATARDALHGGAATVVPDLAAGIALCDRLAPEHLQVMTRDAARLRDRFAHYGGLFLGARSAEVFGDYGVGPNHVLPTGGVGRHSGGLSVLTFLRVRTWLELASVPAGLRDDAVRLAELEGLAGHAAAARRR